MKLLSILHRWSGGFLGLLLALLGLTGTILLWEGSWVGVRGASDRLTENPPAIVAMTERAAADPALARITFASDEIGLHLLSNKDGSGAYVRQDGSVAERWADQWQRPELWLFDLHHHLFAGRNGETVTGVAGIAGLLFVVTGSILWWRTRRNFALRALPRRFEPGAILRHHRDLGIVAAPLLFLSMTTGVLMVFHSLEEALLPGEAATVTEPTPPAPSQGSPIEAAILQSKQVFPSAALRRISFPAKPGAPLTVRLRQPFEWTPNGRTQLSFDASSGRLLKIEDPAGATGSAAMQEKLYPLHTAKVGGVAMKLVMTLSGLSLTLLGSLAVWSFWIRKARNRRGRRFSTSGRDRKLQQA